MDTSKLDQIMKHIKNIKRADVEAWIDGDWNNASDHAQWLETASAKEIADWVMSTYTEEE